MRILSGIWFFYQKLIIPSFFISLVLALFAPKYLGFYTAFGVAYIFLTPLIHYLTYDIRKPEEYYFYHNLGLSKAVLWATTIICSSLPASVLFFL